jgi:hypothetical protein
VHGVDECRLEQLSHHPEREPALEIAAARRERAEAGCPRALASRLKQTALADTGRPFDERYGRVAGLHVLDQPLDQFEFVTALEQYGVDRDTPGLLPPTNDRSHRSATVTSAVALIRTWCTPGPGFVSWIL